MEDKHGLYIVLAVGGVAIVAVLILLLSGKTTSTGTDISGDAKATAMGGACTSRSSVGCSPPAEAGDPCMDINNNKGVCTWVNSGGYAWCACY